MLSTSCLFRGLVRISGWVKIANTGKKHRFNVNSGEEEFFDVVCGEAAHNIKKFYLIFLIPNRRNLLYRKTSKLPIG